MPEVKLERLFSVRREVEFVAGLLEDSLEQHVAVQIARGQSDRSVSGGERHGLGEGAVA